jgi:hypothetical protein
MPCEYQNRSDAQEKIHFSLKCGQVPGIRRFSTVETCWLCCSCPLRRLFLGGWPKKGPDLIPAPCFVAPGDGYWVVLVELLEDPEEASGS